MKPVTEQKGGNAMISNDHVLEMSNVFHSGQIEPGTCFQKIMGSVPTGMILKDVTFDVHAGEVMAVLGSKGSGKKALLEVISRRSLGQTRGRLLLNDAPLSLQIFQEQCGFVPRRVDLLPGLTVRQTLNYASHLTVGSKVANSMKRSRVKQVMADLALNQVSNREATSLKVSDYRRLVIAVQLVRDPVLLLLDDPTADLDPLNTYFVISILSNHCKKYNRMVILSMEKPRSDIFPFLDRVTYLSLGEVVYTGSTRMLMEYFGSIGFPCPELENPLMYYLCLSTVDRRTRERFIESSNQISVLVEKFKLEGDQYRKYVVPPSEVLDNKDSRYKLPLTAYGQPSSRHIFSALLRRRFSILFNCNASASKELVLRLLLLPLFFTFLYLFYFPITPSQQAFVTLNGLVLNCLVAVSFLSAAITAITFSPHRNRYYQESREGIYHGTLFIFSNILYSLPLSVLSVTAAGTIIYMGTKQDRDAIQWATFCAVLWTVYVFVEQHTIALMMIVRSAYTTFVTSIYILIIYIVFGSGTVRTMYALPEWLHYLTYGVIYRYAGLYLNVNELNSTSMDEAPYLHGNQSLKILGGLQSDRCIFYNSAMYFKLRYRDDTIMDMTQHWSNFGLCFVFVGGMWVVNALLYLIPLPAFVKSKFRD